MTEIATVYQGDDTTIVNISIREGDTGMFFATCQDEPTFFISATNLAQLWNVVPCALERVYSVKYHREMKAFPTNVGNYGSKPVALVPKELVERKASERAPEVETCSSEQEMGMSA